MPPTKQRLILFTRYPAPGRAKTRLIPELGPDGAAAVQRELTAHAVQALRTVTATGFIEAEIRCDGAPPRRLRSWLGRSFPLRKQGPGDLGRRLQRAFAEAFAAGCPKVVIMGADCPGLDAACLHQAFATLDQADVVLGPATDGGYYLIGLCRPQPEILEDIPWGTDAVLARSLDRIRRGGLRQLMLPELTDIDRPEDLPVWEHARRNAETLSVIIPTLNEAGQLATTLQSARVGQPNEILVADGGSTDATCAIADRHGARLVSSAPGRARQLNAGAAASSSNLLLFVHADTLLPHDYATRIRRTLARPTVSAGAFTFALREDMSYRRWIEASVALRCRLLKLPYGDQGLFLQRPLFEALGGFPDWPILEDLEMVRRLKRRGALAIEPALACTSGRRWLRRGLWTTLWINQLVLVGYWCGVSRERLATFYRGSASGDSLK